jgi:hypothetical protein
MVSGFYSETSLRTQRARRFDRALIYRRERRASGLHLKSPEIRRSELLAESDYRIQTTRLRAPGGRKTILVNFLTGVNISALCYRCKSVGDSLELCQPLQQRPL